MGGIGHGWWPLFGIHDFYVCDFVLDLSDLISGSGFVHCWIQVLSCACQIWFWEGDLVFSMFQLCTEAVVDFAIHTKTDWRLAEKKGRLKFWLFIDRYR